ncbi:MAG TPA: hypothetical protein VGG60_15240 [Candidatus Binataceae bacterium]|jgi:hypothetical protein
MSSDTALKIAALADNSDILTYSWNDRGVAPRGYIRGMAVMFGRVYCKLNAGRDAASEMATADSGDDSVDALTWYATEFTQLGMDNSSPGVDVLRHLFVLLTGLGMRESSGKHCEGQDSTSTNTSAETAEAGLFQVSHNSIGAHFLLQALFDQYKGSTDFLDIFKEGVSCDSASLKNWGTGSGKDFQALTKSCPAFAVEYAALALRKDRSYSGAINKRTVELKTECDDLFKSVSAFIDSNGITEV